MKRWPIIAAAICVAAAGVLARPDNHASAQSNPGWFSLFDGETLANWDQIGTANWRLENGMIVADNGNGFMVSQTGYRDFDLRVEFWVEAKTKSGVYIRCTDPASVSGNTAYEVNIWDTRPEQKYGTGAIVDVAAVDPMPHAAGRWNLYEIFVRGDKFRVLLNGQRTVDDATSDKFAKGRIALQHGKGVTDESGIVKFRKVEIRPW